MNRPGRHPYVVAHRGVSATYPENTRAAFQAAIDLGVDWIELDVAATADGVVIVTHDTTADRCTNGTGLFREMTFEQTQPLDAGVKAGQAFSGERIPTLDEVITLVEKTPVMLSIEIKGDSQAEYLATAHQTVTRLQHRGFLRSASIASFDPNCLRAVRDLEPLLTVNLDPTPQDNSITPWELCQQALRCGANFISHTFDTLTTACVEEAHAHGLAVWAWTVNDVEAMRRVVVMNVDAVLSDNPEVLKVLLQEEAD